MVLPIRVQRLAGVAVTLLTTGAAITGIIVVLALAVQLLASVTVTLY